MGIDLIIMLVLGLAATFATVGSTIATSRDNAQAVESANQTNIEQVKMTNTANAEQANLAYKRSLPAQQISDMISAGISKPAAMNRIIGGGTYTMPTMQAASVQPKHFDYSGIGDAMERLSGIPASASQLSLQREQLDNLRTDIQIKKDQNRRQEEQHQFDMWQKYYGKDAALILDDLTNRIVQQASDKGINLDKIDTIDKLVSTFNLDKDKIWRDMPHLARSQVVEAVHKQAEENRSRVSAQDTHEISEETIKNSILGRKKTKAEISKILADTATLKQQYDDFEAAKGAREKEYAVREGEATLRDLMLQFEIQDRELRNSIYFDKNGNATLDAKASAKVKEFWRIFSNQIGIEYLGDILRAIFKK